MTRKKLIKQLGGFGITRNTANKIARDARDRGETYAYVLEVSRQIRAEIIRRVQESIKNKILYGDIPPFYDRPDFRIKPMQDLPPWRYIYAIDAAPIPNLPMWPKVTHLDGYSAGPAMLDELHGAGGAEQ